MLIISLHTSCLSNLYMVRNNDSQISQLGSFTGFGNQWGIINARRAIAISIFYKMNVRNLGCHKPPNNGFMPYTTYKKKRP